MSREELNKMQPRNHSEKISLMTTAPVERLVCQLALPSILNLLITAFYNMADTYFVSSLGTSAVASVGIAFPLMAVIHSIGLLFGQGSGNYIAWMLGEHNVDKALRMAATGFFTAVLLTAAVSGVCLLNTAALSVILGATPTIAPYAREYTGIILIGAPMMAGSVALNAQLRFQGSPTYAVLGMISGAVLNLFLDPLFIFVFNMGIQGAAIATILGQIISCAILLYGCSRKGNIGIRLKYFSPGMFNYREIFKGGIPPFLRQMTGFLSTLVVNRFAGDFGDAAIAAVSIVNRIFMFASSAMIGFGQGFQPVCGINYGAKQYARVKRAFWFCVKTSTAGLLIIAALLIIFAPRIIPLFRRDDPEVIRIGILTLRFHSLSLPLTAWIVISGFFTQNTGNPFPSSLINTARQGLFLIPAVMIFTGLFGFFGIPLSLPFSDAAAFFFTIPLAAKVLKKMNSQDNK
ncbi:MAG: MATE family efflux transporter [Spirochaetales bacterium]|jgi:putative MATE family efflux protein|nr:MATE family efflux transporter [Spirochaetales bacterium]